MMYLVLLRRPHEDIVQLILQTWQAIVYAARYDANSYYPHYWKCQWDRRLSMIRADDVVLWWRDRFRRGNVWWIGGWRVCWHVRTVRVLLGQGWWWLGGGCLVRVGRGWWWLSWCWLRCVGGVCLYDHCFYWCWCCWHDCYCCAAAGWCPLPIDCCVVALLPCLS